MQTYFSYANTYGKGVVEGNRLVKHNFNFRETANFFNNKLTVDANVNAMYQKGNNRTTSGGYYMNPLVGLYHFPRGGVEGGKDFNYYKDNYQVLNTGRNIMDQNWYKTSGTDMEQNPYWLINKVPNEDTRYRTLINLSTPPSCRRSRPLAPSSCTLRTTTPSLARTSSRRPAPSATRAM